MTFPRRLHYLSRLSAVAAGSLLSFPLLDCASPGPPRPPSLALPEPVRDLSAARVGERVQLRFTVPHETTDGKPLHGGVTLGSACRAEGSGPCLAFPGAPTMSVFPVEAAAGGPNVVMLEDKLGAALRSGPPRPLTYRLEFFNRSRRSAGPSSAALAAAGEAPPTVTDLKATGSRGGVLLEWEPLSGNATGEVLLQREPAAETIAAVNTRPDRAGSRPGTTRKPPDDGAVWLQANGGAASRRTLDDSAEPGQTFRYTAQRRRTVELGGRTVELRSDVSAPVLLTLGDTFPPAAPANLTAAGFGEASHYAVDLIWEPVEDRGVTGYTVARVSLGRDGQAQGPAAMLTTAPVASPAFHDTTADLRVRYRYSVVAVDAKGNRSEPVTVVVEALPAS